MADDNSTSATKIIVAIVVAILLVIGGLLWRCGYLNGGTTSQKPTAGGGRVATILAVNDIYRINGVGEKEEGGLHRLRTLRKSIEKESGNVLLLHAGDFLSPSLPGRVFKGEQMIDAMNNLDGEPKKFDARMFVAFGNHEFDDSDCNKSPAPLIARLNESQFTWLNVNLDFSNCASMKDVPANKNVKRTAIVGLNGIKIGLFGLGLTPDLKDSKKYPKFGDIYEAARGAISELKDKKADVIVGLTHLDAADDEVLLRSLSEYGLDAIVGGHEHEKMTLDDAKGVTRGFKSDSDAKTARIITIEKPAKAGDRATVKSVKLWELKETGGPDDIKVVRDKDMSKLAKKWSEMTEAKICADRKKAGRDPTGLDCLQKPAGATEFRIELEEKENRNTETAFGRWIAEAVRKATDAHVAIVAAGSLGLNTNLESGTMLRLEQVVDIFRFDDIVTVREVPMSTVCKMIQHGFARHGSGAWPHVGGLKADGPSSTPAEILTKWTDAIKRDDGSLFDCRSNDKVKVASSPYLLCGGDDYPFKAEDGDKCQANLRDKPMDRPNYTAGRLISVIAEQTIRHDKGLKMPPDPGD
jgi:2',3'-cyclic-nucleotide 2'-phosphodiesterase (5'-nucleotidase family)